LLWLKILEKLKIYRKSLFAKWKDKLEK
jgi:hypothetical protein